MHDLQATISGHFGQDLVDGGLAFIAIDNLDVYSGNHKNFVQTLHDTFFLREQQFDYTDIYIMYIKGKNGSW